MGLITFILFLLVWGAIIGGLGRLALPGPDPMTMGETVLIGVGSSLVAGILFRIIFNTGAGIIGSVLVATGAVYLVRRSRGGRLPARYRCRSGRGVTVRPSRTASRQAARTARAWWGKAISVGRASGSNQPISLVSAASGGPTSAPARAW